MKKTLSFKTAKTLSTCLLSLAPSLAVTYACVLFWGEPECPDCLK